MKITKNAIKNRIATTAIVVALFILGLYGLSSLSVDFLPNITYPMIKVHIWWRGATPHEIEKNLADPIERQMATVDDLDYLESSSIEGMYTLLVNFKYGVDVNVAYQDALAAMARVTKELPKDIDPPVVIKADPSQLPVLQLTIKSSSWDLVKLRTWTDEWFQDQMLAVSGVAGAEIVGGLKREIRILLDKEVLEKHGLTVAMISKRLSEENIEQFGGRVTAGKKEIIARTTGEFTSIKDLGSVLILKDGSSNLFLKDIAKIEDSSEEARVITRFNGLPSVKLSVLKQSTANTVEVAENVGRKIEALKKALPEHIELGMVENQAYYVNSALKGVINTAFQAAILVILIIYLFLGSFRQVLIMMLSLPVTLVLNFGLMKLSGFSLNIFSLGGLVVAIGVLLDNSIVVIENITRRKKENPDEDNESAIENATNEVGTPIIAATLSFLALFLPFLLVPGLTSLLFKELILVIAGIVVISLVVAVSVTPMFASLLLKIKKNKKESSFQMFFNKVTKLYGSALEKAILYKWVSLSFFIMVLFISFNSMSNMGSEFLPQVDDGRVMIKVKLPTGTAISVINKILKDIEVQIKDDPLIENSFTLAGGKVWGLYTYEIANEGEINIQLVPKSQRNISTKEYVKKITPVISNVKLPGGKAMVMQQKIKGIRKIGDADIEIKIKGDQLEKLYDYGRKITEKMEELKYFKNIYISVDMNKPEYKVIIDRTKAAELGVSIKDISDTLNALITGTVATKLRENEEYYNIRVMIPEKNIVSKSDVENLPVKSVNNNFVRIKDVAKVDFSVGPVEITRENQIKQVIVRGDIQNVSVGEAQSQLKNAMSEISMPIGYEVSYGGQIQMLEDMKENIFSILIFALFFSFIVLVVQFNKIFIPSVIFLSIPFCLSGLVLILNFTGTPFGATVLIGLLIVVSATVNDGVLLLSFAEELQDVNGMPVLDSVIEAAKIRLRPRIMTTVSTLIGFAPLALNLEEGGDMLQPMALGAIGGLFMEMAVALFLMPVIYVIFSQFFKSGVKK